MTAWGCTCILTMYMYTMYTCKHVYVMSIQTPHTSLRINTEHVYVSNMSLLHKYNVYVYTHTCMYMWISFCTSVNLLLHGRRPWGRCVSSFDEEVGPTARLAPSITVLGLFQMFFTPLLVETIVEHTNKYAHLVLGDTRPWEEVTANDIWTFFGFCG